MAQISHAEAERRWPAAAAIGIALLLYAVMPEPMPAIPPWLVPTIGVLLLVPLIALNPHRFRRETTWSRWLSIGYAVGLTLVNQIYVVIAIRELLSGTAQGPTILLLALEVWLSNVIALGLVYWELDSGGPIARRAANGNGMPKDFRFPQQDGSADTAGWQPGYVDYLYFSLSNMMAFSPTDVMPLTHRAKLLMGYQAMTGFLLLVLVISRAINILVN